MSKIYHIFFAFWTSKVPSRTRKNNENRFTVIKKSVPLISKNTLSGSLLVPLGLTLGTILVAFALLGAPFGASWAPKALQKSKKERKNEVLNRTGRSEGPKARQRCPRTSKIDAKSSKNRLKMERKSDVAELTSQKNLRSIDRLRALALQNKHANFTKEITCFS